MEALHVCCSCVIKALLHSMPAIRARSMQAGACEPAASCQADLQLREVAFNLYSFTPLTVDLDYVFYVLADDCIYVHWPCSHHEHEFPCSPRELRDFLLICLLASRL
jgi:hypothetical protein